VERLRIVTDRWEWDALAQLAATIYHEQSWTLASVKRIKSQTSNPVTFGYARVWVGHDTLVGCPMIRYGDKPWSNSPRAQPAVLSGTRLNAAGAVARAIAEQPRGVKEFELRDDSHLLSTIDRARMALEVRSANWRRYRSMSGREIDQVVDTLDWEEHHKAREWGAALKATFVAGSWITELHVHYGDDGTVIGYLVWVTRTGHDPECIAAALVGERTPAWTVSR